MAVRFSSLVSAACALFLLMAGGARAELFAAEVTLRFEQGQLPIFELTKTGVVPVTTSAGHLVSAGIPAIAGTDTTTFPPPSPISAIELHAALPPGGVLAAAGGPGNALPVAGSLRFVIAGTPSPGALTLPLNTAGGAALGAGGMWTFIPPTATTVTYSFDAKPWTIGTAMAITSTSVVTPVTRTGFAHGPLSNTSTVGQAGGVIQFVTPLQVTQTIGGSLSFETASFATLQIRLLPEPEVGAALAAGALGLAALGRRRARRNASRRTLS